MCNEIMFLYKYLQKLKRSEVNLSFSLFIELVHDNGNYGHYLEIFISSIAQTFVHNLK